MTRRQGAKQNNFDAIRLIAATAVIVSHSFPLAHGVGTPEPLMVLTDGQVSLGGVGLVAFMAVSGYLVTASALRSSLGGFIAGRALRIYPALFIVVALLTFALGPLVTGQIEPRFLLNASGFYLVDAMPGVFSENPYPSAVNGSLWTLGYELTLYLITAFALMLGMLRLMVTLVVWALALTLTIAFPTEPWFYFSLAFLGGSLLYQARPPLIWSLGAACAALIGIAILIGALVPVLSTAGAYLIVLIAMRTRPINMPADLSYGAYIWAFPVQQTAAMFGAQMWWLNLAISLPIILILATGSWWVVERPALQLRETRLRRPVTVAAVLASVGEVVPRLLRTR